MSYENAAATSLLATNCMACRRPLLDAASVTAGMGPICRKKYGYDQIPEGVRVAANALIHEAAHAQTSNTRRQEIADELDTLGAGVVASKIRERFLRPAVIVENVEHTFGKGLWATTVAAHAIRVSFNAEYNAAFKDLVDWRDRSPVLRHGKFWGWAVKPQSKADAWRVVVAHFSGQTAQLPDGRYVTIAGPAARVNEDTIDACVDCGTTTDVYDDCEVWEGTPLCQGCVSARFSRAGGGAPQEWYIED